MSTLVSFHAKKAGWAARPGLEVIEEGQTFRDLCLWIDSNTDVSLFPCAEDGGYCEYFGDAEAYKDESGRIVARNLDRETGIVDIDGEYNTYYVRDLDTEELRSEEWAALYGAISHLTGDVRRAVCRHRADEYLCHPVEDLTIERFCDVLNSEDEWLPVFYDIIEAKGWIDMTGKDFGVCSDTCCTIELDEGGHYYVTEG